MKQECEQLTFFFFFLSGAEARLAAGSLPARCTSLKALRVVLSEAVPEQVIAPLKPHALMMLSACGHGKEQFAAILYPVFIPS